MAKDTKGLLLYFSSADQFFKMSDEELGRFIKKEMAWYMGETDEPEYDEPRSDCMHSRIKEQVQLRGYNAQKQQESREKKKAYQQPKAEVKVEDTDDSAPEPVANAQINSSALSKDTMISIAKSCHEKGDKSKRDYWLVKIRDTYGDDVQETLKIFKN